MVEIAPRLLETVVFSPELFEEVEPPSMTPFVDFVSHSRWLMLRELVRSNQTQPAFRKRLGWSANKIWQILFGKKFDPSLTDVHEWFWCVDTKIKFKVSFDEDKRRADR